MPQIRQIRQIKYHKSINFASFDLFIPAKIRAVTQKASKGKKNYYKVPFMSFLIHISDKISL